MQSFLIVAIITFIAAVNTANIPIPEVLKANAMQYITECKAKHPITDDEFAKMHDGTDLEGNENAKCFTNCFQEKAGIVKDGAYQEAKVLEIFSTSIGAEKTKAIIEICRSVSGSGQCDTAYKLHQCFKKNGAY